MGYILKIKASNGKVISSRARDKRQAEALARISIKAGGKFVSIRKSKRRFKK